MKIFSETDAEAFVGRPELERIVGHGLGEGSSGGLAVLARPDSGSSELLRQAYDRIFLAAGDVIPFYFQLKPAAGSAREMSAYYLRSFLMQLIAFRRRDPSIIQARPGFIEILDLAPADDREWIEQLLARSEGFRQNDREYIRHCLNAPFHSAELKGSVSVIIDDLHAATLLDGGDRFLDDLLEICSSSSSAVTLCAHRRFLYGRTNFPAMRIDRLSTSDAANIVEILASRRGIAINEQTRDLIALQLDSNPRLIDSLLLSAGESATELTSFANVQKVYTDEIFGGRISRHFDRKISRHADDRSLASAILALLNETGSADRGRLPLDHWRDRIGSAEKKFDEIVQGLFQEEVINIDGDHVIFDRSEVALSDYVTAKALLQISEHPRAVVVGETVAANIRRAPKLMAHFYQKNSSLGLLDLIRSFNGQPVSPALLDYSLYRDGLKGAPKERVLKSVVEDNARIRLPDIAFAAYTSAFYPQFDEVCQKERSVTAISASSASKSVETVWLAAEIESKLEASREITEFWCDRLEMAAVSSGFEKYRIWLIAPEGFSGDAMDILGERGGIGSSREQVELLAHILLDRPSKPARSGASIFEFVIPMGDETEMIAANTVEEIARHHHVPARSINQIKTALIEACINAVEHSHSPDRRIYQTITVDAAKIVLTVANRGLRLTDKDVQADGGASARRGWGLKLIKGLMDEVKIDETDDGTRITMVKYLQTKEESGSEQTATGAAG